MRHKVIKVLKKKDVRVGGSVQLGEESASGSGVPAGRVGGTTAQQARIVESNNEYAIIEIVCSCGHKTHVQCNYSQVKDS